MSRKIAPNFIPFYRDWWDGPLYADKTLWILWCELLRRAKYGKPGYVNVPTGRGKTTIPLNPGQLITGRKELAKILGCTEKTAENRLKRLEPDYITRQPTPHYTIVTIRDTRVFGNGEDASASMAGQAPAQQHDSDASNPAMNLGHEMANKTIRQKTALLKTHIPEQVVGTNEIAKQLPNKDRNIATHKEVKEGNTNNKDLSRGNISSRGSVGSLSEVDSNATSKTVTGGTTQVDSANVSLEQHDDEPLATDKQVWMIRAKLNECGLKKMKSQDALIQSWIGCSSVDEIPKRKVREIVVRIDSLEKKDIERIIIRSFEEAAKTIYEHFVRVFGTEARNLKEALWYIGGHMADGATEDDLKEWMDRAMRSYDLNGFHPEEYPWPELFFKYKFSWKNRGEHDEPPPVPGFTYIRDFGGYWRESVVDREREWIREQRGSAEKTPAPVS